MSQLEGRKYVSFSHTFSDPWSGDSAEDAQDVTLSFRFAKPNKTQIQRLQDKAARNAAQASRNLVLDCVHPDDKQALSEAMEELGVETGISSSGKEDTYVSDCTVETDQEALIPDSYIGITAEKIRIYKELDSLSEDRELDRMREKMSDRFGKIPEETERLFDIVRIRHLAEKLGFEKVIIKNGIMIAFFISNGMSGYYRSRKFADILDSISRNSPLFELKKEKLRIIVRNVPTIQKAYSILKKL